MTRARKRARAEVTRVADDVAETALDSLAHDGAQRRDRVLEIAALSQRSAGVEVRDERRCTIAVAHVDLGGSTARGDGRRPFVPVLGALGVELEDRALVVVV